jgi:ABC-type nickel/cobalt efflux system permease component RcnA
MGFFFHWIEALLSNTPETLTGYGLLLGLSLLLGITHTFGPGHGKSLLLGVLVADSRRVGHALKMALVIGITHMTDVLVLSLVSIFIVSSIPIGTYSTYIGFISGVGILVLGLYRIYRVAFSKYSATKDHNHDPSQSSQQRSETENLWTAFLYSLAPCPGAWILFMACLGSGEPVVGVFLLTGFTLGLLTSISGIALSIVYSLEWMESVFPDWVWSGVSLLSGVLVSVLGLWIIFDPGSHIHNNLP